MYAYDFEIEIKKCNIKVATLCIPAKTDELYNRSVSNKKSAVVGCRACGDLKS